MTAGYYRHPTIHGDQVVFGAEDDLWSVAVAGGSAHRLTANPGTITWPRFSPNGENLAFISRDEGPQEVHVIKAGGGGTERLSYLGALTQVVGWHPGGESVLVASDWQQPFAGWMHLVSIPVDGRAPRPMKLGPSRSVSFQHRGSGAVMGRDLAEPARWKRYRGGRAGTIWIDRSGSGEFEELVSLDGNLADPMWLGRRIYFVSDHEGAGNLYSVTPAGRGLRRHTHNEDFYVRSPSTDGSRVVFYSGADLHLFDPPTDSVTEIEIDLPSSRPQRNRRFQTPGKHLETIDLHPQGHSLAITARGGAYTMPLWEGAPLRHGAVSSYRQRLATWMPDGETLVAVTDEGGEEQLGIRSVTGDGGVKRVGGDLGRVRSIDPAPAGAKRLALTNHRHEVMLTNLASGRTRVIHRSPFHWITGTSWSPDGRWLAFSSAETRLTLTLFLHDTVTGRTHRVGHPDFTDFGPAFDSEGKYLYFLSGRVFDPVADSHFHDYGFPKGVIPCLITLRAEAPSPFAATQREPRAPGEPSSDAKASNGETKPDDNGQPEPVHIDIASIEDRIVTFPVPEARYVRIAGAEGRVFFLSYPVTGSLDENWTSSEAPGGKLEAWDFSKDKVEAVAEGVSTFVVSADGKVLSYREGKKLRVVPVAFKEGEKNSKDKPGRESGWVDLDRVRVEVRPGEEWRQMYSEAWRLQRDYFWWEDMGGIDWVEVHDRYLPLVDRVASRGEFSDLMWEMQGELGTSHAYELGGDYRPEPRINQGSLGADLAQDPRSGSWRVDAIPRGDSWNPKASSPLATLGIDVKPGDRIVAIDGVEMSGEVTPSSLLVDRGGREVSVVVQRGRRKPRTFVVQTLASETALRYRHWVEQNRLSVHETTGGRGGYIHIPDMIQTGYAEFQRYWRAELERDGLVVDVRFNRGGNVSQLLLQRLLRLRLGYRVMRWREPAGFPHESPSGPMVALTNENAGSDGDIFSHAFKMHGLGPLIGTRTWGGVVGIWPQQTLVDGTLTTQPEFGTWFTDVGYDVENYGTEPDIEVIITPQDYREGRDPQLERAVEELLSVIEAAEPLRPEFGDRPSVKPPKLPR